MFLNRRDAGNRLALRLQGRQLHEPLVLAIPRGGVVIGSILARELEAELDVVLARNLRAPGQPELAIGAVAENGDFLLNHFAREVDGVTDEYLARERAYQRAQIAHDQGLFRAARAPTSLSGRSVIVTDDGVSTGSTLRAALRAVKQRDPLELIAAVPVASVENAGVWEAIRQECDELVCLIRSERFWSIDQFYEDFNPVGQNEALELLRTPHLCPW